MVLLVMVAPGATPICAVNANAPGVVSAGRVVAEKFALTPPMVTVTM